MTTGVLDSLCEVNPETLGLDTPADFRFRYLDISAVTKGRIDWLATRVLKFADAPSRARRRAIKGDVLLCTVRPGLQAHARIVEDGEPLVCSTGFAVLRPRDSSDSGFVFHQLFSEQVVKQLRALETGSNYPAVNEGDVRGLRLFTPPKEERTRIAAVLDIVDEAIAKADAVIAKLRHVWAGLLRDLLTRGLGNDGKLRDPIAQPEQFKDSLLGNVPVEWDVNIFMREVALRHGYQFRDHDFVPRGFPVVKITAVSPLGYLDLSDTTYIAVERAEEFKHVELHEGDILMSLTGNIGRCVRVPALQSRIFQNYRVGKFEPLDTKRWDKDFLFILLSSFVVYDQIARRANLTAQANIGKEEFEGIYLPVPNPIEQKAIATALFSQDSAIRAETDWAWKLQQVKSGLTDDLLTGRVRVPVNCT